MAEIAPPGGGGINRRFLLIVGGLGAALVLGLLGLGFVLFGLPLIRGIAQPAATPTRVALATSTLAPSPTRPTATDTATLEPSLVALATAVPLTATPTVLAGGNTPAAPEGTTTPEATTAGQLPQSGLGDTLLLLGGGVVLLILLFVVRRLRTSVH